MSTVLVPLADGLEPLEAVTIIDLLRRAGIDVTTASLTGKPVEAAHDVTLMADTSLDDALAKDYDMVALPGGTAGAMTLRDDERVQALLKKMAESGKFTGAVCAAPMALHAAGLLEGKTATAYPGVDLPGANNTGGVTEVDGKVITGRGPGTAMDFALQLIESLEGKAKRDEVEGQLVRP